MNIGTDQCEGYEISICRSNLAGLYLFPTFFLSFFLSLSLNEVIPCERRNDHDYTSSRRISAKDLPHSQPTRPSKCGKTDIQPTDTTMAGAGAGAEIVSARNHEVISSKIIFLARKMKSRWGGGIESTKEEWGYKGI